MATYVEVSDLEKDDIFFVNREFGFCTVIEIVGLSFHSGRVCLGLEPYFSSHKKYFEMFFLNSTKK